MNALYLFYILVAAGLFTAGICYFIYNRNKWLQKENQLLKKQQQNYKKEYELLQQLVGVTGKFRHDLRNHMQIIERLIETSEKTDELLIYKEHLKAYSKSILSVDYCSHPVLNAIFHNKDKKCMEEQIRLSLQVSSLSANGFQDIDLAVILFNLFDNGIESCLRIESSDDRFISIETKTGAGYLIIQMNNAKSGRQKKDPEHKTSKKDKIAHGLGLSIVSEIAERYEGKAEFTEGDSWFKTTVWLKPRKYVKRSETNG